MQIWAHKPKWVQMNILPFLPAYGAYSVFCTYTNKIFKSCLFSKYTRAKLPTFVSCPSLTRQPNSHECTLPLNKTTYAWFFWDAHPQISKCHQNLLKVRVIVNKNPNRKFSKSTISNKSENVQNNILSIFTWHHFCPPILWNPNFCNSITRWTPN